MVPPETGSGPTSLEPLYKAPSPPPLPVKESKKKTGLKAMNNVPDMEMGRTFHSDAAPTNDYEGEILDKVRFFPMNNSKNCLELCKYGEKGTQNDSNIPNDKQRNC